MSGPRHSYDLFERRSGWAAEVALVISPYVEREFFMRVARDLRPRRLHVVVDDGCRRDDLETVRSAVAGCGAKRPPKLVCRLGSASGLVHLKLFYVIWSTPAGRVARTLVFGSANATRQGFSGDVNAELIASCRLAASRHGPVIAWCEDVIAATLGEGRTEVSARRDVELGAGSLVRLPRLSVGREVPELGSLDLWIQRGYLLSEYRPDPSFLRVPIQLTRGLAQADQARVAASFGFLVPLTKRLNYDYVPPSSLDVEGAEETDDDVEGGNWRRKLFVWTHLGDWCSETCFEAHRRRFKRRGFEGRQERLRRLEELRVPTGLAVARGRFLAALSGLWAAFGTDASTLLRGVRDVDERFYSDSFDQRVERDLELATDDEFRERYVDGYELVQVPRFRNDLSGWREFVGSLSRQLCLDAARGGSQSKLLQAVREALQATKLDDLALEGPEPLLLALRGIFRRAGAGGLSTPAHVILDYHSR